MRGRHVVAIVAQAVPEHFRIDASPAPSGMFVFLDHQSSRAFPHHKSIPIRVERAAGRGRFRATHRLDDVEGAVGQRAERRLGRPGDEHIGHAIADVAERLASAWRWTAGAAIRVRGSDSLQAEFDRDVRVRRAAKNLQGQRSVNGFGAAGDEGNDTGLGIGDPPQSGAA